ncbi:hypothetical protein GH714_031031 [Hevea brasiliensis]|uniref:Kinesin motor domain-containing protein n=1 Tax=Hevea brasiliensis TaxID=3981 RepID=A0A6A6N9G4_HEVBR|nr:hypothetical protein GH714_031031 [Hevea brasiliensis]
MVSIGGTELPKMEKMPMASAREENILVLVRLRPLNEKEIAANEVADWECINDTTILYRNTLREGSTFPSAYTFDRVFRGDYSTRQVYEEGAKEVALSVVSGINSSIFAYGQTSSGKTYTMTGITEYTVADIFEYIHRHEDRAFVLKFSAIEIYNEAIRDLLSMDSTPLRLLDDPEKGTIIEKVTEETLKDWSQLKELLSICEGQRQIGETSLNEKSSRSHQILRLTIESSAREFIGKENSTTLSATVLCKLQLVPAIFIIHDVCKGRYGHINYRDSKLTRLLQPALGGNARTAIICTLSPARRHVEQTRNTLLFACCAKEVTTKAQVNVVMSDKALVKHLQRELARLESELRSPVTASSTSDYAALLRKKDLQIQKMEKEIRELTKQRDLAESRVEDLLRMIGQNQTSRNGAVVGPHPNQQAGHTWEDEYGDSGSNMEESYYLQDNNDDHSVSDGTSSLMSIGKKFVRSSSCQSLEDTAVGPAENTDDYCKEVQCIEMDETRRESSFEPHSISNGENEGTLALTMFGDDAAAGQQISTPANGRREVSRIQNGFTYDMLEQRLHHVQRTVDDLVSPDPDETSPQSLAADISSSRNMQLTRSWSCRENLMTDSSPYLGKAEQIESTPPNGFEKSFSGRPEGVRRKFPPLNYGADPARLSRNDSESSLGSAYPDDLRSQSIKTSADGDIPSIQTFVEGLQEMAKQEYEKQLVDGQVRETDQMDRKFEKNAKDVGLDPMGEALETSSDWPLAFERQRGEIIELWQTCNVSLVHRAYFFLLFKGDPTDSVYMEVELRRLSFLKETLTQGNHSVGGERNAKQADAKEVIRRRRKRIYQKWGIGLNSKRRRLQLANSLWSNTKDINHIMESAAIVGKLASNLREKFDANKHVEDLDAIDRMIAEGEAQYNKWRHPDPYIVPWAPGGSKFTRNPTPPSGIEIVYNYGREDND